MLYLEQHANQRHHFSKEQHDAQNHYFPLLLLQLLEGFREGDEFQHEKDLAGGNFIQSEEANIYSDHSDSE